MVAHTCHPSFVENINRRTAVQADQSINSRPYLKNTLKQKWLGVCLKGYSAPNKPKAMSSNPSTIKKGRKERRKGGRERRRERGKEEGRVSM
jgi:hypothetical protein